jgi:hypothetical protein
MALCFFLVVEATGFFLAGAVLVDGFFLETFFAGLLSAVGVELDWAAAGDKEPGENRNKVPAKNATAKLRTKALPTAGSWRP